MKGTIAYIISLLTLLICFGCGTKKKLNSNNSEADVIIEKCLLAHGSSKLEKKGFQFNFRGGEYRFIFNPDRSYHYESVKKKDDNSYKSILTNKNFEYFKNDVIEELDEKKKQGLLNSLNSVVYFATLPYKLTDESVFKKKLEDQQINGKDYYQIQVSFSEKGGGTDFDDVFHYWVNKKNYEIDYLAYLYHTGKGGVRFREAYNKTRVDDILFQDYKNFKAPVGTDLNLLAKMFEKNELILLSEIKTENVESIPNGQ